MESPLCEVIIEGNKIQKPNGPLRSPVVKGFTGDYVIIAKSMVRLRNIETEEDRTKIEIKGVQLEVSVCKNSVKKLFARMNVAESTFT